MYFQVISMVPSIFFFVMGSLLGKGEPEKSASFVAATGLGAPEVRIASVPVPLSQATKPIGQTSSNC